MTDCLLCHSLQKSTQNFENLDAEIGGLSKRLKDAEGEVLEQQLG